MRKLNPAFGATFLFCAHLFGRAKSVTHFDQATKTNSVEYDQGIILALIIMQLFIDNFQVPAQSFVNQ